MARPFGARHFYNNGLLFPDATLSFPKMSFKQQTRELLHRMPLARFHPVLLDSLADYNRHMLTRDISAGLTVGMVALPLAMAFGIASGVPPEAGLYTAIIAGFLISLSAAAECKSAVLQALSSSSSTASLLSTGSPI